MQTVCDMHSSTCAGCSLGLVHRCSDMTAQFASSAVCSSMETPPSSAMSTSCASSQNGQMLLTAQHKLIPDFAALPASCLPGAALPAPAFCTCCSTLGATCRP
jgi:hypothetical protein